MARTPKNGQAVYEMFKEEPPMPATAEVKKLIENLHKIPKDGSSDWWVIATYPENKTLAYGRANSLKQRVEVKDKFEVKAAAYANDGETGSRIYARLIPRDLAPMAVSD